MERFLRQNLGKQAEVVFSAGGETVTASGIIAKVTEDEVLLRDNDVLTAGNPDDVLLVRITAPSVAAMAQETQTEDARPLVPPIQPQTETTQTTEQAPQKPKGRVISPSLRARC